MSLKLVLGILPPRHVGRYFADVLQGCEFVRRSEGQKAWVALARAVYARTKFVLLDDPLSAVKCCFC